MSSNVCTLWNCGFTGRPGMLGADVDLEALGTMRAVLAREALGIDEGYPNPSGIFLHGLNNSVSASEGI